MWKLIYDLVAAEIFSGLQAGSIFLFWLTRSQSLWTSFILLEDIDTYSLRLIWLCYDIKNQCWRQIVFCPQSVFIISHNWSSLICVTFSLVPIGFKFYASLLVFFTYHITCWTASFELNFTFKSSILYLEVLCVLYNISPWY